jgi:hypothetical protein
MRMKGACRVRHFVVAACPGLVLACGVEPGPEPARGASDAGAEAATNRDASGQVRDGAGPPSDAAAPIPPWRALDAMTSDAEHSCALATVARPRDATATTPVDMSNPAVDWDAAAPPEDCLAPCVWDVVRHCLPPVACTYQDYGSSGVASQHLSCGENDWWDIGTTTAVFNYGYRGDIYVAGRLCFSFGESERSPSGIFGPRIWEGNWGDANGDAVAVAYRSDSGDQNDVVFCRNGDQPLAIVPCTSHEDCLSKGILAYGVAPTASKCAPWRRIIDAAYARFDCARGCCPTDPPAIPSLL